jgi:hypothetical protein
MPRPRGLRGGFEGRGPGVRRYRGDQRNAEHPPPGVGLPQGAAARPRSVFTRSPCWIR